MAKKKASHQSKQSQEHIQPPQHLDQAITAPAMDDQLEKLQSLKSLNSILLKETHERRLQVDALTQVKKGLESELSLSSDETIRLDLEKWLMCVFMEARIGDFGAEFDGLVRERVEIGEKLEDLQREMKMVKRNADNEVRDLKMKAMDLIVEIENEKKASSLLVGERDGLKDQLGAKSDEANRLMEKVVELEKREKQLFDDGLKQRMEYKETVKKTMEMEETVKSLRKEKDLAEKFLKKSSKTNEDLGKEVQRLGREKAEIETKMEGLKIEMENAKNEGESEIMVLKKKGNELMDDIENKSGDLNRVMGEKSELMNELTVKTLEADRLREKVLELKETEGKLIQEAQEHKKEHNETIKKMIKMEISLKSLMEEKDLTQKSLSDSLRINEDLKMEIMKVKNESEEERNRQVMKIQELEKEVNELTENVMALKDMKMELQTKISELEKMNMEDVESRERMLMEFNDLNEQKLEKEKIIATLMEEKSSNLQKLEELKKKLQDQDLQIKEIVREKSVIEKIKALTEKEIVELQNEMGKVTDEVLTLQETCKVQTEEIIRFKAAISQSEHEIRQIMIEKGNAQKGFENERINSAELNLKVLEMEKKLEQSLKEITELKTEYVKVFNEKKELGNHCQTLIGENGELQKSLVDHQRNLDEVRANLESKCENLKLILTMLQNTAAMANKLKDESNENGTGENFVLTSEKKFQEGDEIQSFSNEFEAIKDVFLSREMKVEEMKKRLEFLQSSVVEANKKKSFWTMISSATTLLFAASVAYVARGH